MRPETERAGQGEREGCISISFVCKNVTMFYLFDCFYIWCLVSVRLRVPVCVHAGLCACLCVCAHCKHVGVVVRSRAHSQQLLLGVRYVMCYVINPSDAGTNLGNFTGTFLLVAF